MSKKISEVPVAVQMLNSTVVFHQGEKYPALKFLQHKQQVEKYNVKQSTMYKSTMSPIFSFAHVHAKIKLMGSVSLQIS